MERHDYSEEMTEAHIAAVADSWEADPSEEPYVKAIKDLLAREPIQTVIEVGFGTGWVPRKTLGADVQYVGIDKSAAAAAHARRMAPGRLFLCADVRHVSGRQADLALASALFRHFAPEEWEAIVARVVGFGDRSLCSYLTSDSGLVSDAHAFWHVWATRDMAERAIAAAGHEIVSRRRVRSVGPGGDDFIETRRL